MSIGLLTKEDEAVVWRGPMLMGALQQMLGQVQWGQLDVLIVDLPPGTGDVQMTLSQKAEVAGAIIVSTPQDVALLDARKAINMFQKMDVARPRHDREHVDLHLPELRARGAHLRPWRRRADAERLGLPFLGEIPLDLEIRLASDGGAPVVATNPDGPQAAAFRTIARRLIEEGTV